MTTVYVAMINDRHTDPEPFVFDTAEKAITFARAKAHEECRYPDDFEEREIEGWLYYASYSCESDSVWVIERQVNP